MKTILPILTLFISIQLFAQKAYEWPIKILDTARDVNYLSDDEKDVILEMNMVRYNPAMYAKQYMRWMQVFYTDKLLKIPGKIPLKTEEGKGAYIECMNALENAKAVSPLKPIRGMTKACELLVYDQSSTGETGHKGSGNSTPADRANRFGSFNGYLAENIHYGDPEPRYIVISLLIDDGVRSRVHRKNILSDDFNYIGIAIGDHKIYGSVCVVNYATEFNSK